MKIIDIKIIEREFISDLEKLNGEDLRNEEYRASERVDTAARNLRQTDPRDVDKYNEEMKAFMPQTLTNLSPMYIRLGKDSDPLLPVQNIGYAPILVISTGIMSYKMTQVREVLAISGIYIDILHESYVKPLNSEYLLRKAHETKLIITAEEGIINGGLGSAVLECLADNNIQIPVLRFGLPDAFPHHYGEQAGLLDTYGLTPEKMAAKIKEFYERL